jgi:hypothetical protein
VAYACRVDFTALIDRVKALKVELAEIQVSNAHYLTQLHRTVAELQAHVRRRERLEQIVHELSMLRETGTSSMYRKFR